MQTNQLPEVGKTYISQVDPTLILRVIGVDLIPDTEEHYIEACPPDQNPAPHHEVADFISDEWFDLKFIPHKS